MARYCEYCGSPLNGGTARCPRCGMTIGNGWGKPTAGQTLALGKRRWPFILIAVMLAVALLGVGGWFVGTKALRSQGAAGAADAFLTAYEQGDAQAVQSMLIGGGMGGDLTLDGVTGALRSRMGHKVTGLGLGCDDSCDVEVAITNVDFAEMAKDTAFADMMTKAGEDGDPATAMAGTIQNKVDSYGKLRTTTVPMRMTKDGGNWKVTMTSALSDALLGGYPSYQSDMLAQRMKEQYGQDAQSGDGRNGSTDSTDDQQGSGR